MNLKDESKLIDFWKGRHRNNSIFLKTEKSFWVGKVHIQYLSSIIFSTGKFRDESDTVSTLKSLGETAACQRFYKTANGFYDGGKRSGWWEHMRRRAQASRRAPGQHHGGLGHQRSWGGDSNFHLQRLRGTWETPSGPGGLRGALGYQGVFETEHLCTFQAWGLWWTCLSACKAYLSPLRFFRFSHELIHFVLLIVAVLLGVNKFGLLQLKAY